MACSDVASLFDALRIKIRTKPNCPDYNHKTGYCGYDNIKCKIIEYERVK